MDKKMVTHYPVSQHHFRYIIPLVAIQKKKKERKKEEKPR